MSDYSDYFEEYTIDLSDLREHPDHIGKVLFEAANLAIDLGRYVDHGPTRVVAGDRLVAEAGATPNFPNLPEIAGVIRSAYPEVDAYLRSRSDEASADPEPTIVYGETIMHISGAPLSPERVQDVIDAMVDHMPRQVGPDEYVGCCGTNYAPVNMDTALRVRDGGDLLVLSAESYHVCHCHVSAPTWGREVVFPAWDYDGIPTAEEYARIAVLSAHAHLLTEAG